MPEDTDVAAIGLCIVFCRRHSCDYPFMIQMAYAISAHEPARERSLDIARVKAHLIRVFSDLVARITDAAQPFQPHDAEFIFAGYSWMKKEFRIWNIHYVASEKRFAAREAHSFHPRLPKAAFIGDWSKRIRGQLTRKLQEGKEAVYLEPLNVIAEQLRATTGMAETIGGPPQLIRITQHMNTRPLCVRWKGEDTLFGRPLFDYENADYWTVDPFTGEFSRPRKFGHRISAAGEVAGES